MRKTDFSEDKLRGPGAIVQIDETMLNYKCKSHRGRSPYNKTDALIIVETHGHTTRMFARVIQNKCESTILPIICEKVISGSVVYTDEFKGYSKLSENGFLHETVCNKCRFIDSESGVHIQSVEAINNLIKRKIKMINGVFISSSPTFLKECCFFFSNKEVILESLINLLKVEPFFIF